MTKLRGTEAEIYARLRELTEEFRQIRKELVDGTHRQVPVKSSAHRPPAKMPRRRSRKPKRH